MAIKKKAAKTTAAKKKAAKRPAKKKPAKRGAKKPDAKKKAVGKKPAKTGKKKAPRRQDWESNHVRIRDAFLRLLKKHKGRKPTYRELSEITGLAMSVVQGHIRDIKFKPKQSAMRVLTDDVILAIHDAAKKGRSRSQELWLAVMEGWIRKTKTTHDGSIGFEKETAREIGAGMSAAEAARIYMEKLKDGR